MYGIDQTILLALLAFQTPTAPSGQITGDRELLRQAAIQSRANREAIITWQGEAELVTRITGSVDSDRTFPGQWDVTRRSKVKFAFDRTAQKLIYTAIQEEESGRKGSGPADGREPVQWGLLQTSDVQYNVGPWYVNGKQGHPKRPTMLIQNKSNHSTELSTDFNPFHLLDIAEKEPYNLLMMYAEALMVGGQVTITRSGDLVTLSSTGLGGRSLYVFSLGQSGVPVTINTGDHAKTTHLTIDREFKLVNSVWVPHKSRSVIMNVRDGKPTVTEKEIVITHQSINQPVPPEAFSPLEMGIRKGDKVRDTRTGAEYLYDEETDPLTPPRRSRTWVYAVVGGAGLLTLLLMLAGWRWRRRTAQEAAHAA